MPVSDAVRAFRLPVPVTILALLLGFTCCGCGLPSVFGRSPAGTGEVVLVGGPHSAGQGLPGAAVQDGAGPAGAPAGAPAAREPLGHIFVHVEGAVASPGVYRLLEGARACDALALAGGETVRACLWAVNLAAVLQDGQQLYVPTSEEVAAVGGAAAGGQWASVSSGWKAAGERSPGPINVNLANAQTLQSLPGIGPVLAGRIVAYRESNGPFGSVDDLLSVSGIGPSRLADLREKVVVR